MPMYLTSHIVMDRKQDVYHGAFFVEGNDAADAETKALAALKEKHPENAGWTDHDITCGEVSTEHLQELAQKARSKTAMSS